MSKFKNELAKFVYMRTYSRYLPKEGRRETWEETVTRVVDYYRKLAGDKLPKKNFDDIYDAILNFEVMPSMRLMWSAGKALDRNSFAGYNCAFTTCDDISVFGETLLILMLGAGEGFSVEQKYIDQLPIVGEETGKTKNFVIEDSKEGWSEGLDGILRALWEGHDVTWDTNKVRPLGAKIKTFGGTASGPKVLVELFEKVKKMLTKHRGRRLSALNVHDIMCKIAEITCSAGVRRSALLSISDLHHEGMRGAKQGQFWLEHPERAMSNNSACFRHKPTSAVFMEEWLALAKSGSGERGVFNLSNIKGITPKRRDSSKIQGSNPCCISGDTKILTTRGYRKPVELQHPFEIEMNTKIYKAKGFVSMGVKPVYRLVLGGGKSLKVTLDHRIKVCRYLNPDEWVEAKDLKEGDEILTYVIKNETSSATFESLEYVGTEEVWDCEVEDIHLFVANNIIVHNCEIFLRSKQCCNLTEAVIRKDDTMDTLLDKIKLATIMGTIQSMLTNFGDFVSKDWEKNAIEERLLGVSLTGQMDNPKLLTEKNLQELRDYAIGVNTRVARKLEINRSASITTSKPSGTVSQLVDSSSGFHARFAPYYLRRVRISASDPLYKMMLSQGVKFEPEVGQTVDSANTWVCEFPVASPKGCITVEDLTAIEQLEQWLKIKENYTEHTVSATIYVNEDEWFKVGNWVFEHFDRISGVSFLPKTDHVYQLAPYHEITKEEYKQYKKEEVIVDYSKLPDFEKEDEGEGANSKACESDRCELTKKD